MPVRRTTASAGHDPDISRIRVFATGVLPTTVTAKYHFDTGAFKPYLGAGVAHLFILDKGVVDVGAGLGVTDVNLPTSPASSAGRGGHPDQRPRLVAGPRRQALLVDMTATFRAGDTVALRTEHELDPWVVSAGVGHRF